MSETVTAEFCGGPRDGEIREILWRWPSGYLHTETRSVAIVTMHWAMGRGPTDMLTASFAWTLLDRLLILEKQVSELLTRVESV